MKKFILILFVLTVLSIKANAQIPNNGFENWRTVVNTIEPVSWHSLYSLMDSSGSYNPVTRSTDHYPSDVGTYSARIANDTALWNSGVMPGSFLGWGILISAKLNDRPLFAVTGHPKSLRGYYKFIPQKGDTMNIHFHLYKNGVEVTAGSLQTNVAAPNWTSFKIYAIDTLYASADSARIGISTSNDPKGASKPHGNSVLYIDNLSFDNLITSPSSVSESAAENTLLNLYPNPASGIVSFYIDKPYTDDLNIVVYNSLGALVKTEMIKQDLQINITDLSNGIYMVVVRSKDFVVNQRMIVQR